MGQEKLLIRQENFGYLLYSIPMKCYYTVKNNGEFIVSTVLNNLRNGKDVFEQIDAQYLSELKKVGFDNNIRVLDHRNKVSRQLFVPLEYYFDFSNKCNLRCPHCYNSKHLGKITMPEESVSAIIDEMYDLGVMRLHLAGGEPTIEKKGIANYLSTAKKHNIVTSMATNGTLLTDEMCEILLGNDMFAISISLDGYDEETNNKRRGEGFFSVTVDGVRRLIKKRDEMGKKTEICLKPIYEYNTSLNFFDRMTEFAISLGVDKIKFSNPERSVNHELGYYGKHIEPYYEKLNYISELQVKYKGKIAILNVTNPIEGCFAIGLKEMRGCIGGQELLTINPDGRITPCLMNDTELGDYFDYRSINKFLLTSKALTNYISSIQYEPCFDCEAYSMCRGGCQVRKRVEYGKIQFKDPYCPMEYNKAELKKLYEIDSDIFDCVCVSHSL